jgi:transcription antitermination protein NusB
MASNRHLGRIIALQTLYEIEFRRDCADKKLQPEAVLNRNISRFSRTVEDKEFVQSLVKGVSDKSADLDAALQPAADKWPIDQIARIDRIVLRIGLHELLHARDIPAKVVINEAVELAKSFGGEKSSKFINGVLGTLYKQQEEPVHVRETTAGTPKAGEK